MELNTSKTKEMILGRIDLSSISPLSIAAGPIQRVTNFKLLGINLDASQSILDYPHQYHHIKSK